MNKKLEMSDTKILDDILEMLETNQYVDWDHSANPWEEFREIANYIKTHRKEPKNE